MFAGAMPFLFGDFALDPSSRQLRRNRQVVHIEPKAFELLRLLIEARPAALTKADIRDLLWPDTFVSEGNLTRLIAQLRRALGDRRQGSLFIRTVHGFGYAFAGEASDGSPVPAPLLVHRVVWGERVIELAAGQNLIGRDEAAVIFVKAAGVSRRHAQIVVAGSTATLEDLGSKNGTYHRDARLAGPVSLENGDLFRVARHLMTYRSGSSGTETVTQTAL